MIANSDKPRLRWPLDVQHVEDQGRMLVLLVDPYGVADSPAAVPSALSPILSRFDGEHTVAEIASEGRNFGVTEEFVAKIALELDSLGFLDTAKTRQKFAEVKREYRELGVREAALAGAVYPAEPEALTDDLKRYLKDANSPVVAVGKKEILGLICPHIDYQRGWQTYASAYSILEQLREPDVIFLIGTSHQASERFFHLSDKHFATPIGTLEVAADVVGDLAKLYGVERSFDDEILHRNEHSLELQVPFLVHRYRETRLPKIVPILVGSFHEFVMTAQQPLDEAEISDFVAALAEVCRQLRTSGKKIAFYGGIDLAHVGQHFGDRERDADNGLEELEAEDRGLLDAMLKGDEAELFEKIAETQDKNRICGFPSMYTTFAAMRQAGISLRGELVEYRQAVDPALDCIVTFASAYWTENALS